MPILTEIAYAKINLALHVRRRRDDGYHELETVFAFADTGDVLTAEPADQLTLEIVGPFADGLTSDAGNLVMRAALALRTDRQGAKLTLEKNLPIASGIGGGSADAAAALRLLNRLWGADTDLMPIAASLGADVPACVKSCCAVGFGTGAELGGVANDIAGTPVLLVNPGIELSTAQVFVGWWGFDDGPMPGGTAREIALYGKNGLELSAMALVEPIADVLEILRSSNAFVSRMSGSGATCFGLYDTFDALEDAREKIAYKRPQWWTMATVLR